MSTRSQLLYYNHNRPPWTQANLRLHNAEPRTWTPWAGLALLVSFYVAVFFNTQWTSPILIAFLFMVQAGLCLSANNWAPFLILCGTFYLFPHSARCNDTVTAAVGLAAILVGAGLLSPLPQIARVRSRAPLVPLVLLTLGFATALPAVFSTDRYDETLTRVTGLAAAFGALPVLCARWVSPRRARLCILIVAAGIAIYYALAIFSLSTTLVGNTSKLDSVQGFLTIGRRSIPLTRTHIGPTLAIACCTLWGLLLTERQLLLRAVTLLVWALGSSALLYTGARGAMGVEVFVCLCAAGWMSWRKRRPQIVVMAVFLGVCLLLAVQVALPQVWSVVSVRLGETSSAADDYSRIPRWLWSLEFFWNNPMGVGWTLTPLGAVEHAHNDPLVMAMSFGIFGGAAYLVAFAKEWIFLTKRGRGSSRVALETTLPSLACLVALFACGFMDMVLAIGSIFHVSWLIVVLGRADRPEHGGVL